MKLLRKMTTFVLVFAMVFASFSLSAFASVDFVATLIKEDNSEVNYTSVQHALDDALNEEIVVLNQASDEVLKVEGKAVGVVYHEFGMPEFDVQCNTKIGKQNARIVGDLQYCIEALQSGNSMRSRINAIATIDSEASAYNHFYLYKDVTFTKNLTLPAYGGCGVNISTGVDDIVIDLNGHTIDQSAGNGWNNYPVLSAYSNITIKDSGTTGKILGVTYGVEVTQGNTITLEGGTISTLGVCYQGNDSYLGAAARILNGTIIMKDGVITGEDVSGDNKIMASVVCYVLEDGQNSHFEMQGGKIIAPNDDNAPYAGAINTMIYDYENTTYGGLVDIYSGTFSRDVNDNHLAKGCYERVENGETIVEVMYAIVLEYEMLDGSTSNETLERYAFLNEQIEIDPNDLEVEKRDGYVIPDAQTLIVAKPAIVGVGTLVCPKVLFQYKLKEYTIEFNVGENGSTTGQTSYTKKHGENFPSRPIVQANQHFRFEGWTLDGEEVDAFPANVLTSATYDAKYQQEYLYTVEIYEELVDGSYHKTTRQYYDLENAEVSYTPQELDHYHLNEEKSVLSGQVSVDEALVLKVYYDLDMIKVTFDLENQGTSDDQLVFEAKYGSPFPNRPNVKTDETCDFIGWSSRGYEVAVFPTTMTQNYTFKAMYSSNYPTIVETYVENLDGTYEKTTNQIYGKNNEAVSVTPVSKEHYHVNNEKSVLTGVVNKDTPTVLKVYYDLDTYEVVFIVQSDEALGTFPMNAKYGQPFNFVPEIPLRVNKEFVGWYLNDQKVELPQTVVASGNYVAMFEDVKKDMIKTNIRKAEALNEIDYTPQSFNVLKKVLEQAYDVYANPYATQKEVDEASKRLEEAIKALVKIVALPFVDVSRSDWFYQSVYEAYTKEIMLDGGKDKTLFEPDAFISRGMVATVLLRIDGNHKVNYQPIFSDVSDKLWYSQSITWAATNKVVSGYGNTGRFGPDDQVLRQDLAIMIRNYAKFKGINTDVKVNFTSFADGNKVDAYAASAIAWCVENKIMSGTTKADGIYLNPTNKATRAECAKMFSILAKLVASKK